MSRKVFIFSLICILFFSIATGQISSTAGGGYWSDTLTWVGHKVPTASQNVTIVGPVIGSGVAECKNLTIGEAGSLEGGSTEIFGDLVNNGSIIKKDFSPVFTLHGDLTNNGPYDVHSTYLTGKVNHFFTFAEGASFASTNLKMLDSLDIIYSLTSLTFQNTTIQSNYFQGWNGILIMQNADSLTLDNSNLSYMDVDANGNKIIMKNDSYINSVVIQNPVFEGLVNQVFSATIIGEMINNGIYQNNVYGASCELNINGSITNNGTIRDNFQEGYRWLIINVTGDIINNGVWSAGYLKFCGEKDQNITFNEPMTDVNLSTQYPDYDINVLANLRMDSCRVALSDGTINLLNGSSLTLTGTDDPYSEGYMYSTIIEANGNDVIFGNRAYLSSDVIINNANLKGTTNINSSGVQFNGNMILTDTLQVSDQATSGPAVYFNGTFTNNGVIRKNGSYTVSLHSSGSVINNGIWETYYFTLDEGATSVECQNDAVFNCSYFQTEVKDTIDAAGDVNIRNAYLSFKEGLFRGNGNKLNFGGTGYSNYFTYCNLQDFILEGNIKLGSNVTFLGTTVLNDTMTVGSMSVRTTLEDNFTNNGIIIKNGNAYLSFDILGDIVNNGFWESYYFEVKGTTDQSIYYPTDKPIARYIKFHSDITSSTYQWLKNGEEIANTNYLYMSLDSLNARRYGNYICRTSDGDSRIIKVFGGTMADFSADITEGYGPLTVQFTNNSIGAIETYKWLFGNGDSSEDANPQYTYNIPGLYTVTLIVDDGSSQDTIVKEDYINVLEYIDPVAEFSADTTFGNAPFLVQFTNTSQGNDLTYKWYFGDGESSEDENPQHTYTTEGLFDVTLIVADEVKADTLVKQGYISTEPVSVDEKNLLPTSFQLHPCYPNPFNSTTNIKFDLPEKSQVSIQVYDLYGTLTSTIINTMMDAGYKQFRWETANISSGLYIIKISTGKKSLSTKVMYLK